MQKVNSHRTHKKAKTFFHITSGVFFTHTLNLATQKAIKCQQVDRVAARIRRIVPFFHKSSTATAIMESKQHLLELPKHKLIQDVSTRWNSTYDMFSRYIEQ